MRSLIIAIILLCPYPPEPTVTWLNTTDAVVTWYQATPIERVCVNKNTEQDIHVLISCEVGTIGEHRVYLRGTDEMFKQPESQDQYFLDYYHGTTWDGRTFVGQLPDRPQVTSPSLTWLDDRRVVISWQQTTTTACLSKAIDNRWIFLGCEDGVGPHQRVLGEPGGDAAWLPEAGDRYWIDAYDGGRWLGRSSAGVLDDRPVMVYLPLVVR